MAKYLVASDIHGSGIYCKQLLDAFYREAADHLILLGDILYHGPRNALPPEYGPAAVIEMLNGIKEKIICVRGNCDAEVDQMVLDFDIMADYKEIDMGGYVLFLTHGHLYNEQMPPKLRSGDILLNGHTHIPMVREHSDFIYMNPGSVGIPKNGSKHSYMLIENDSFKWFTLEGEMYMDYLHSTASNR